MCNVKECSLDSCPFALTEHSETIQNYGCLPSSLDILTMKIIHNKTWACHSNPSKPCLGGLLRLKELGLNFKFNKKDLVTESDDFSKFCSESDVDEAYKIVKKLDDELLKNKIFDNLELY